jgi:hypothetical protein
MSPPRSAASNVLLLSKPTSRILPFRPRARSASNMPSVEDSFGMKMPSRSLWSLSRLSDAFWAVATVAPASLFGSISVTFFAAAMPSRKPCSRCSVLSEPFW